MRNFASYPGQGEIADRNHMRIAVAQSRMATSIAKSVELLDVTQRRAGLLRNPLAQATIKGSVADWIKGTRRQSSKGTITTRMHS